MGNPLVSGTKRGMRVKPVFRVKKFSKATVTFFRRHMRSIQSVGRAFQRFLWGRKKTY